MAVVNVLGARGTLNATTHLLLEDVDYIHCFNCFHNVDARL